MKEINFDQIGTKKYITTERGFNGTFHHFSKKHINRYINEFSFRLNEGNVKVPTMDRILSIIDKSFEKRLTYKELTS